MVGSEPGNKRGFRLYTLHSHKGGVGKTSIAVAIACIESALLERKTLFLDGDLTGTCVLDAFEESPAWRVGARWFNDLLLADPDSFLRVRFPRRKRPPLAEYVMPLPCNVDCIPSRPELDSVRETVPTLAQEHFLHHYQERLLDVVLAAAKSGYQTVVFDLSPGLFGLSEAAFLLATNDSLDEELKAQRAPVVGWAARPIVVTTPDKVDYRATYPAVWQLEDEAQQGERAESNGRAARSRRGRDQLACASSASDENGPPTRRVDVWFNKFVRTPGSGRVDPAKALESVYKDLKSWISSDETRPPWWSRALKEHCKAAPVFGFAEGFSMDRIPAVIERTLRAKHQEHASDDVARWVREVREALDVWPQEAGDGAHV